MMMCIGSVSDFEAQIHAAHALNELSAEERELAGRSLDWLVARECDSHGNCFGMPIEPSHPYSHGRRFIPAWLAAERERCMAGPTWGPTFHNLFGYTLPDLCDSILVMYDGVIVRRTALT